MKINPSIDALKAANDASKSPERLAGKTAGAPAQPGVSGDRVELSALSTQMAALETSLAAEPGFDRAKVESIKRAIVEGRLGVDAEVVADKMIASALAVVDRGSR